MVVQVYNPSYSGGKRISSSSKTLSQKIKTKNKRAGATAHMLESFPNQLEALRSIPRYHKKKRKI
jgi:hypothetical protein